MNPLVSILIPCYNAEPWLPQCIESALAQTYPNKEIVVVDDGSTDKSLTVARSYGDRIRVKESRHMGGNAARNKLLSLARGEWLQYLDADDYLLPNKIEHQIRMLRDGGFKIDVVYGTSYAVEESTGRKEFIAVDSRVDANVHFIQWAAFTTNSLLLKRTVLIAVGGWNEELVCCQERELIMRLLMSDARFAFVDEAGAVYCYRKAAVSSKIQLAIEWRIRLTERFAAFLRERGLETRASEHALAVARMECARKLYRLNPEKARSLANRVIESWGRFVPTSKATNLWYRLSLAVVGFDRAEAIAKAKRRFAERLMRLAF